MCHLLVALLLWSAIVLLIYSKLAQHALDPRQHDSASLSRPNMIRAP